MKYLPNWIVVADAMQAQVYTRKLMERHIPMAGIGKRKTYIEAFEHRLMPVLQAPLAAEALSDYEAGRNLTGMVFESVGMARHMSQPHRDARNEIKQHFAQKIADFLEQAEAKKAFSKVTLVAPPEMLGEIESRLSQKVKRKVNARLAKALTHFQGSELDRHLRQA